MKREERGVLACYNKKFMSRVISLFYLRQGELGIKERFNLHTPLATYKDLLSSFFLKVFSKELDTEVILGVKVLLEMLKGLEGVRE